MSDIIEQLNKVRRGVMFVVEAPSGTGKTTVIKRLLEQDKNLKFSVSVTTRTKREGEVDGIDYHYVSDAEYDKMLKEGAFYEAVNSQYGARYAGNGGASTAGTRCSSTRTNIPTPRR